MNKPTGHKLGRILLVEDDITLAGLYKMRMETEGFDVKHVGNGEEALQAAKEYRPDLVLLDIMMPKLDGFDVLDILHNTPALKGMKIVILSAIGEAEEQAKAMELGADEYLVKSQVLIAEVMARIRSHLNLPPLPEAE